MVKYRK